MEEITEEGDVEEPGFVSSLKVPAPRRIPYHETLGERRSFMLRAFGDPPTIAELEKHAERFGSDQVVETGAECGYGLDSLVRLQDACDRFDAAAERERHPHRKGKKLAPSEDRIKALLGIKDEEDD